MRLIAERYDDTGCGDHCHFAQVGSYEFIVKPTTGRGDDTANLYVLQKVQHIGHACAGWQAHTLAESRWEIQPSDSRHPLEPRWRTNQDPHLRRSDTFLAAIRASAWSWSRVRLRPRGHPPISRDLQEKDRNEEQPQPQGGDDHEEADHRDGADQPCTESIPRNDNGNCTNGGQ